MSTPIAALTERVYVSQFDSPAFGLNIYKDGVLSDPDGEVIATLLFEVDGGTEVVLQKLASQTQVGSYQVSLSSVETQKVGYYTLRWTYAVQGTQELFETYLEVGPVNPAYDELDEDIKDIVDVVWLRFADLYDSPDGGPHAQIYLQTHFTRGRFAQLLGIALRRLNVVSQPKMSYSLSQAEGKKFPVNAWGGVLEQALYIEVIKHLRRIYTEQPEVVGVNVARMDRRDYLNRWGIILQDEEKDFTRSLEGFKIAHMGLGSAKAMVGGGVYGNYGPTRVARASAARPRFWSRWY
jgi:hypothetical protein